MFFKLKLPFGHGKLSPSFAATVTDCDQGIAQFACNLNYGRDDEQLVTPI